MGIPRVDKFTTLVQQEAGCKTCRAANCSRMARLPFLGMWDYFHRECGVPLQRKERATVDEKS